MMISCPIGFASCSSNRISPSAFAVSSKGPNPTPPPVSKTAGNWGSISSSTLKSSCTTNYTKWASKARITSNDRQFKKKKKTTLQTIARQNDGRIGNAKTRIWDSFRPSSKALFATISDGEYNLSTSGWKLNTKTKDWGLQLTKLKNWKSTCSDWSGN